MLFASFLIKKSAFNAFHNSVFYVLNITPNLIVLKTALFFSPLHRLMGSFKLKKGLG